MLHSLFCYYADPMPPSPPHSLTSVPNGARSFTANWEAPEDDGGLPILDYTVEILNMGNQEFCPQPTQAWQLVARVTATEAVITAGVYSSFQYQFRVTAFNHLFNTTSTPSPTFTTLAAGGYVVVCAHYWVCDGLWGGHVVCAH